MQNTEQYTECTRAICNTMNQQVCKRRAVEFGTQKTKKRRHCSLSLVISICVSLCIYQSLSIFIYVYLSYHGFEH